MTGDEEEQTSVVHPPTPRVESNNWITVRCVRASPLMLFASFVYNYSLPCVA